MKPQLGGAKPCMIFEGRSPARTRHNCAARAAAHRATASASARSRACCTSIDAENSAVDISLVSRAGDEFEHDPELVKLKNLLIDILRGEAVSVMNSIGIDHVIVCTGAALATCRRFRQVLLYFASIPQVLLRCFAQQRAACFFAHLRSTVVAIGATCMRSRLHACPGVGRGPPRKKSEIVNTACLVPCSWGGQQRAAADIFPHQVAGAAAATALRTRPVAAAMAPPPPCPSTPSPRVADACAQEGSKKPKISLDVMGPVRVPRPPRRPPTCPCCSVLRVRSCAVGRSLESFLRRTHCHVV